MTELVTVPAAPTVPPFPALGDPNFNQLAYDNGSAMPGVSAGLQAIALTAFTNATVAGEKAAEAALSKAAADADAVATAADRAQTGADRTQTGLDRTAAAASAVQASKLNLGSKATPPTVDNQGAALLTGATYYDTTLSKWRVWTGSAWGDGISSIAGVSSINGLTGDVSLNSTSLSGSTTIYVGQVIAYTITDFDSFSTYAVAVSAGSVTRTGADISFTAPTAAQNVTLTVTTNGVGRAITLTVLPATVATPTITGPASGATDVTETPTITSSAFATAGLADTHLNSDWELWTGPNRTGTKVDSLYTSTTSKTSWAIAAGVMAVSTTYYPAVRHRGTALGDSAWGVSSFATAASFNSYITTPTATPAAFGGALEGGFYAGMIWNELVQSSTSTLIGTGSKSFTVPSMSGAPIVYAGQTLEVRSRANPNNKMIGTVTGASGTTLTINITSVGGSGTFTDWSVMSRYRIIVAPKSSGENASIAYKNANTAAPVACGTLTDGRKATLAMVAADTSTVYPAAHYCNNLNIAGRTDWYLPARDELELCWRNIKPTADANYVSPDRPTGATPNYQNLGSYGDTANTHGLSPNTSPAGAAHTSGVPAQTAVTAFRTGGVEAFEYGSVYYWSSTEYDASYAWLQYWISSFPGGQYSGGKAGARCVRAVRRSII